MPAEPTLPTIAEPVARLRRCPTGRPHRTRGTARAIVERLNTEMNNILRLKEMAERLRSEGVAPAGGNAGAAAEQVRKELLQWRQVVQRAESSFNDRKEPYVNSKMALPAPKGCNCAQSPARAATRHARRQDHRRGLQQPFQRRAHVSNLPPVLKNGSGRQDHPVRRFPTVYVGGDPASQKKTAKAIAALAKDGRSTRSSR